MSRHFRSSQLRPVQDKVWSSASGQVRAGRGVSCQARSEYGQDKSGQVRSSQVRKGQERSCLVKVLRPPVSSIFIGRSRYRPFHGNCDGMWGVGRTDADRFGSFGDFRSV